MRKIVAVLLKDSQSSEVLLVDRGEYLTLPTGHFDPFQDESFEETVYREMAEEFGIGLKDLEIVESLGIASGDQDHPSVVFEIFSCKVSKKEVGKYQEGRFAVWIRPSQAVKLPYLDPLARTVLERYVRKYPGRPRKEEEQNETGRDFSASTSDQDLAEAETDCCL